MVGMASMVGTVSNVGDLPRLAALHILRAVDEDDAYAHLVSGQVLTSMRLQGRDAAFALNLAYGVLRWRGLVNAIWMKCTERSRIDGDVQRVLGIGTHQMLQMQVPPHAAIATSVDLIRTAGSPGAAGFVNAVLRAVQAKDLDGWFAVLGVQQSPDLMGDLGKLGLRWSHPEWIVEAFAAALGPQVGELPALLAADNEPPRPVLVALPGLITPTELTADPRVIPGRLSPLAAHLVQGRPDELTEVRDGRVAIQDEGSQLAALALSRVAIDDNVDDDSWLDLCAGPGGKAAVLAGLAMTASAQLTAVEPHPSRARLLADRLAPFRRTGQGAAQRHGPEVVIGDARQRPWGSRTFSRVLVDAPCSGIGALRRRPESRWRRTPADLHALVALQRELLLTAIDVTKPGGVVLYVTCSPHPAETVDVIAHILQVRHGRVTQLAAGPLLPEIGQVDSMAVQLWPHRHGTDAMFIAALRVTEGDLAH
jgi:16S rRNA (cytosine967-C5)-methyltransferase